MSDGAGNVGKVAPARRRTRRHVRIFDTTLRDGEQAPGIALTKAEKVEIAEQLARLNVDILEAGFPISSDGEFDAVREIADTVKGPVIAALARTATGDIERAARGAEGRRPLADPHVHLHQRRAARVDAEDELRPGAGRDPREREARQELHRGRGVQRAGRHANPAGVPAGVLQARRAVRRHHDQRARHRGLRHAHRVR